MDEQKKEEDLQEGIEQVEGAAEEQAEKIQVIEETTSESVEQHEEVEAAAPELPKKLEAQPKQIGAPIPGRMDRLKAFILECKRVLRVTKKPDKQEFLTIVKISAIGMAVIGVVGFLVHFAKELLF